jgi:hypothetical protein
MRRQSGSFPVCLETDGTDLHADFLDNSPKSFFVDDRRAGFPAQWSA